MLKFFWWRFLFLFVALLFEISFLNVLFPGSRIPGFLINVILAIVLLRGFHESSGQWLSLLIIFDILRSGTFTLLIPISILLAYGVSFISRRFLIEHRGSGLLLMALLSSSFVGGLSFLFSESQHLPFSWTALQTDFLLTLITFIPIFLIVQWFEERLDFLQQAEFRGLRH